MASRSGLSLVQEIFDKRTAVKLMQDKRKRQFQIFLDHAQLSVINKNDSLSPLRDAFAEFRGARALVGEALAVHFWRGGLGLPRLLCLDAQPLGDEEPDTHRG